MTRLKNFYRRIFFQDPWFTAVIAASLLLLVVQVVLLLAYSGILYHSDGGLIPLHYKVVLGIDFLGPWYYICAVPVCGAVVLAANYLFFRLSKSKEASTRAVLSVGALCLELVFAVFIYLIIQINLV